MIPVGFRQIEGSMDREARAPSDGGARAAGYSRTGGGFSRGGFRGGGGRRR
jgi:hypothetical protein